MGIKIRNVVIIIITVLVIFQFVQNMRCGQQISQLRDLVEHRFNLSPELTEQQTDFMVRTLLGKMQIVSKNFTILADDETGQKGFDCLTKDHFCSLSVKDGKFLMLAASGKGYNVGWSRLGDKINLLTWGHITATDLNGDLLADYIHDARKKMKWIILDGQQVEAVEAGLKNAETKDGRSFRWTGYCWEPEK